MSSSGRHDSNDLPGAEITVSEEYKVKLLETLMKKRAEAERLTSRGIVNREEKIGAKLAQGKLLIKENGQFEDSSIQIQRLTALERIQLLADGLKQYWLAQGKLLIKENGQFEDSSIQIQRLTALERIQPLADGLKQYWLAQGKLLIKENGQFEDSSIQIQRLTALERIQLLADGLKQYWEETRRMVEEY